MSVGSFFRTLFRPGIRISMPGFIAPSLWARPVQTRMDLSGLSRPLSTNPAVIRTSYISFAAGNAGLLSMVASRLSFLSPQIPSTLQPSRGYKSKFELRKRCEHCFFLMREGRLHVECHKKPRHKARHRFRIQDVLRNRTRKLLYANFYGGPNDSWPTYDLTEIEMHRYVQRELPRVK